MSGIFGLFVFLGITFTAAFFGSIFTASSMRDWYATLAKPALTPPGWVFGPVWTALYVMMTISVWLVWRQKGVGIAVGIWIIQIILNAAWSFLFFGLKSPAAGLIGIILLWGSILLTIIQFWPNSRLASGLMMPYLLWVSFAGFLNYGIWRLNP